MESHCDACGNKTAVHNVMFVENDYCGKKTLLFFRHLPRYRYFGSSHSSNKDRIGMVGAGPSLPLQFFDYHHFSPLPADANPWWGPKPKVKIWVNIHRTGLAAFFFSLQMTGCWNGIKPGTLILKKEERRRRRTIIICCSSTMCLGRRPDSTGRPCGGR